jgi:hypothetical protein
MIRTLRIVGWVLLGVGIPVALVIAHFITKSTAPLSSKVPSIAFAAMLPLTGAIFAFQPKAKIVSSVRPLLQRVRTLDSSHRK